MIVVAGEALMDVFDAGATLTGVLLDARIGGSPLNVATGLARLGQPVSFLGAVSSGFLGDRLMRALDDECIGTSTVERVHAPTTLGLVGLNAQGVADYAFYGERAADRQLSLASLAQVAALGPVQALHVGSYATVVEPIATTLRALITQIRSQTLISYDPNLRRNVEPRIQVWRGLFDWMLPRTDVLKVSDEDLRQLLPGVDDDALAARCLHEGVGLLVITRGGAGASGWTRAGRVDVRAEPVSVVDTVGAGDTFQAALLTGLAEQGRLSRELLSQLGRDDLTQLLQFAARAAGITCTRRGADLPRRVDLNPPLTENA